MTTENIRTYDVMAIGAGPVGENVAAGIEHLRPRTSREATSAEQPPGRLAVVGAGVVGVETAAARQASGSRVTLPARGRGLLPRMEPFAGELVTERLRGAGADVCFDVSVLTAARAPDGEVRIAPSDGDEAVVDEILSATGRAPRTEDVGLETVGLAPGHWMDTDDSLTAAAVPGGVAVRRRRRQPPGTLHPPGQVPGPHRGRSERRDP